MPNVRQLRMAADILEAVMLTIGHKGQGTQGQVYNSQDQTGT